MYSHNFDKKQNTSDGGISQKEKVNVNSKNNLSVRVPGEKEKLSDPPLSSIRDTSETNN